MKKTKYKDLVGLTPSNRPYCSYYRIAANTVKGHRKAHEEVFNTPSW